MGGRSSRGAISGYLLKLIRESMSRSQEELAEDLRVDRATVQGWESGRRPIANMSVDQCMALRRQLGQLGGHQGLLAAMDRAFEADHVVAAILDGSPQDLARHPLAGQVMTHSLTDLVAWALTGRQPRLVRHANVAHRPRRGPVPDGPRLSATERSRFFWHLRDVADRARSGRADTILLHRQACYLGSLDHESGREWLALSAPAWRFFHGSERWSPLWPDARSLAISLARQGDPEPLRAFVQHGHADDTTELAGLAYWACWVEEIEPQPDDSFMVDRTIQWRGTRVLQHIVDQLDSDHAFIDLNVHTIWALLQVRRGLAHDYPDVTSVLMARGSRLLDEDAISAQSRRELTSVLYGLRMDGFTGREGGR